jgi:putative flavoprotein involved in K+ transport
MAARTLGLTHIQFPNWTMALPGHPYRGSKPDDFASRDEVVAFVEHYAAFIRAPVRAGAPVTSLIQKPDSARYIVELESGHIEAANVVVATGPYQEPLIPQQVQRALQAFQIHSSRYSNAEQLPPGAVLVVGSGASGCQIAEDLLHSGRRVFLSVGSHRRVPRRYRGRDYAWWAYELGEFDCPVDQRPTGRAAPLLTGVAGGHDVDLRRLARAGVVLLGRISAAAGNKVAIAPDLQAMLVQGDLTFSAFVAAADAHVHQHGLDVPADISRYSEPEPNGLSSPTVELDIAASGISAVIWATGFRYEFGWLRLPIVTENGGGAAEPVHRRGVTSVPGVYFLGLQWLSKRKSSLMAGVGEDAEFLADQILGRR